MRMIPSALALALAFTVARVLSAPLIDRSGGWITLSLSRLVPRSFGDNPDEVFGTSDGPSQMPPESEISLQVLKSFPRHGGLDTDAVRHLGSIHKLADLQHLTDEQLYSVIQGALSDNHKDDSRLFPLYTLEFQARHKLQAAAADDDLGDADVDRAQAVRLVQIINTVELDAELDPEKRKSILEWQKEIKETKGQSRRGALRLWRMLRSPWRKAKASSANLATPSLGEPTE